VESRPLTAFAHSKQNLAPEGSCVPQLAHRRASGAAHSRQNLAWGGLSCWHRGHFMSTPTRRARLRSADDSVGAEEGQLWRVPAVAETSRTYDSRATHARVEQHTDRSATFLWA
jgi:hypothetical protein